MSTLMYAALTRDAENGKGPAANNQLISGLTAAIPAEVLAAHTILISFAAPSGSAATSWSQQERSWLAVAFFFFAVLCVGVYWLKRLADGGYRFDFLDVIRSLLPGLSFAAWTMLNNTTLFDAAFPLANCPYIIREVVGLCLALLVLVLGSALSPKPSRAP